MDDSVIFCGQLTSNHYRTRGQKRLLEGALNNNSFIRDASALSPLRRVCINLLNISDKGGNTSHGSKLVPICHNNDEQLRKKKKYTIDETIIISDDDEATGNVRRRSLRLANKKQSEIGDDEHAIDDSSRNKTPNIPKEPKKKSPTKTPKSRTSSDERICTDIIGKNKRVRRVSPSTRNKPDENEEPNQEKKKNLKSVISVPKKRNKHESKTLKSLISNEKPSLSRRIKDAKKNNEKSPSHGKLREIIVDGSNVARRHAKGKSFSRKGLELVLDYFLSRGHQVRIFVPSHEHKKGQEYLQEWESRDLLTFTPSRRIAGRRITPYDDRMILEYATNHGGIVVSSDEYRDLWKLVPEWRETIEMRLLSPTFVGDEVLFPDDPLGRFGPTLYDFLRH